MGAESVARIGAPQLAEDPLDLGNFADQPVGLGQHFFRLGDGDTRQEWLAYKAARLQTELA